MARSSSEALVARPAAGLVGLLLFGGAAFAGRQFLRRLRRKRLRLKEGSPRAVVLGLGYCGGAIARRLKAESRNLEVFGTTRGVADAADVRAGVHTLVVGDDCAKANDSAQDGHLVVTDADLAEVVRGASLIVATAPPGEGGDPFLAQEGLREAIAAAAEGGALVIYLSSVGVYGDQQGREVTEDTPCAPRTARAKRRFAAEEEWRKLPAQHLAIVRLPGIYGPFRGPLAKAREGNTRIAKEGHLFSRIHVDDVASLCALLWERDHRRGHGDDMLWKAGPVAILNCCDSDPAPQHEVSAVCYQLLGLSVPPAVPFDSAELSAMQRSFYEESRHMVNTKLISLMGGLRYSSYRTGLPACLAEEKRMQPYQAQQILSRWMASSISPILSAVRRTRHKTVVRVALVDNGSLKPEATLSLRRLAAALQAEALERSGAEDVLEQLQVEAVSARFADRIPPRDLEGRPAEILPGWLERVAKEACGKRQRVLLLPLLIGPSSTATKTLPDAARAAASLEVEIAPTLICQCPALYAPGSSGATELAGILMDRLAALPGSGQAAEETSAVFLCDHGSPVARVTAAREAVRKELEQRLGQLVTGCCMERREGSEFDFNGLLLEQALLALPHGTRARVALLFLQAGRHAGAGGDIATIVQNVGEKRPDLSISTTEVLAGHSALIDLLLRRLRKPVPVRLFH